MSESKFIPNSFQVPNIYIDEIYPLLDEHEKAILIYACRRIFGWQKRTDRISLSQFSDGCGINKDTVSKKLKNLEYFNIIVKVSENDTRENKGAEWGLQLDSDKVDWSALQHRKETRKEINKKKMVNIRNNDTRPMPQDSPMPQDTPVPSHRTPPSYATGTQNTLKPIKDKLYMGENKKLNSDVYPELEDWQVQKLYSLFNFSDKDTANFISLATKIIAPAQRTLNQKVFEYGFEKVFKVFEWAVNDNRKFPSAIGYVNNHIDNWNFEEKKQDDGVLRVDFS